LTVCHLRALQPPCCAAMLLPHSQNPALSADPPTHGGHPPTHTHTLCACWQALLPAPPSTWDGVPVEAEHLSDVLLHPRSDVEAIRQRNQARRARQGQHTSAPQSTPSKGRGLQLPAVRDGRNDCTYQQYLFHTVPGTKPRSLVRVSLLPGQSCAVTAHPALPCRHCCLLQSLACEAGDARQQQPACPLQCHL
jgi:hypothetical protein